MIRDFEKWLSTMKRSMSGWNYYTDFSKAYENSKEYKYELNLLNSLVGSKEIETEFKNLISKYPTVLKAVPILLAKREKEIQIIDKNTEYNFNFIEMNYSVEQYVIFMKNTGLFELLELIMYQVLKLVWIQIVEKIEQEQ